VTPADDEPCGRKSDAPLERALEVVRLVPAITYRRSLFGHVYEQRVPNGTLVIVLAPDVVGRNEHTGLRTLAAIAKSRDVAHDHPPHTRRQPRRAEVPDG
jgi:hypothetical protein